MAANENISMYRIMAYISRGEKRWIEAEARRQGLSVSRLIKTWIIRERKGQVKNG